LSAADRLGLEEWAVFLIDEGEKDIDRTYLLRRCAAEKVSRLVK